MELTDIMALVKAGYTKDEIAQMEKPSPRDANTVNAVPEDQPVATSKQEAEPIPAPHDVPVAVPAPVPAPVPQPAQQEAQPTMAELMQSIAKLTSAVQANAIAQSTIPAGISNPPKAEDMLAEIIRPTYRGKED